jgi:hypothetical protein
MSFSEAILPIVDAIAALPPLPAGFTLDGAGALPQEYRPNTLYAAPLTQQGQTVDTGQGDQALFRVRLAYCVDGAGEDGGKRRLRAVSDAQDAGVVLIADAVRANRARADLWEWLQVDNVQYDAIAQHDCRAAWIDLSGWRYIP